MDQSRPQTESSRVLNHGILEEVHRFWFRHLANEDHIVVPDKEEALVWFSLSESYDKECVLKFSPTLEALRSMKDLTADDILQAAQPSTPLQWISLIILLDQIPRNCYRGKEAGFAYSFFDPLALDIAFRAIKNSTPDHPDVRYKHCQRFWFYLPLEHSEDMEILDVVAKEHEKMFGDSHVLIEMCDDPEDEEIMRCCQVLRKRKDEFEMWERTLQAMRENHVDLIKRFGRYPYRNRALGRESTAEEIQHLAQKSS